MSTLTISIDRTALALAPLLLSAADDGTTLGIADYTEPALQWRIGYAPDSAHQHGSVALSAAYQQSMLNFSVGTDQVASEAAARAAITELRTALSQFAYTVTVTTNGVAETWTCDPGSIGAASRTFENLKTFNTVYPVSIPCHPVRS